MAFSKIFGEQCVRCHEKRTKQEFEGLPTCEKCEAAIRMGREDVRACPACGEAMTKLIVMNVIVDKCPACKGAWLDGGELELLQEAIHADAESKFANGMVVGMAMG